MTTPHPLTEAREEAKLSKEGLAKIVGASRVTIWRIESGQFTPSLELVARIKGALRANGVELSADAFIPKLKVSA